jgi:DNA-binding transcriptional LysR family regulator
MNNADNVTADEPRITFEAAGISTLRGLVAAGLGVAIVPVAPSPVPGLIELLVSDSDAYREIGLGWRARTGLRQAAIRRCCHDAMKCRRRPETRHFSQRRFG